ncbi:MAG TPA: membrane protein insertase YidC [Kiritimatiellia bacterium]|nr:membrane protein insertase YidC [Kiritimatiellia bacterium]
MKRQDYLIFFVLLMLLLFWPNIYQKVFGPEPRPRPVEEAVEPTVEGTEREVARRTERSAEPSVVTEAEDLEAQSEAVEVEPELPERLAVLRNDVLELTVSSRGGGILDARLLAFRELLDRGSDRVFYDFRAAPALVYERFAGLGDAAGFDLTEVEPGRVVRLARTTPAGLRVTRTISLTDDYMVLVRDEFVNAAGQTREIPDSEMRLGRIPEEKTPRQTYEVPTLGVDSLPASGGAVHWTDKLPRAFQDERDERGLRRLPESIDWLASEKPLDWIAAKNKYFAQILMPVGIGGDGLRIRAWREVDEAELRRGVSPKKPSIVEVSALVLMDGQAIEPGEVVVREFEYYVGPKEYWRLSQLSHRRDAVMGFAEVAFLDFIVVPIAKVLLKVLNAIQANVWPYNYGVAIMLLTLLIKIIFWPVTHKSTESMRKMAELQPLMQELREKHKDNPQKQSQEMMNLYKEHKVNPLGGCLPMLIQIPVFFALFVVLRIAIELRFAEFLWIRDLSAPERIIEFGFALPLLGWDALNILPILMTLTMYFQQKMMPAGGDPQQQKIMRILLPGMMFFFLYNFASGLALYWTTQNLLMIAQQGIYKYRKAKKDALAKG